jgi:hypothetical protein
MAGSEEIKAKCVLGIKNKPLIVQGAIYTVIREHISPVKRTYTIQLPSGKYKFTETQFGLHFRGCAG